MEKEYKFYFYNKFKCIMLGRDEYAGLVLSLSTTIEKSNTSIEKQPPPKLY